MSSTPFPLGFFASNPNGNDATAMAQFESLYNQFSTLMGARPAFMDGFTDFTQDPSTWAANASWTAWSWAQTGAAYVGPTSGTTPVIGVPLASNAGGWSNVDTFYQQIIAGQYDADYAGIVAAWAGQGYTTMQARLGYEFNGNFMAWAPSDSSSPTADADFIAAWQHVANVMHAAGRADGITVQTVWNPADINWETTSPAALYPGNQYVDIVGTDAYSPVYPLDLTNWSANGTATGQAPDLTTWAASATNRDHFWMYNDANQWSPTGTGSGWSMADAIAFAKSTGKPLAIEETGSGNNGTTTGPNDDPAFPQFLAAALAQAQAQGVTISNVNIWATDQSDGNWGFLNNEKPLEAAAWAQGFGATASGGSSTTTTNTTSTPVPVTWGSGPDSLVLTMSEDYYQGDAQFTVSIDGVQIGPTFTTTAHASLGQTQTFTLQGTWGTAAHVIGVTFTNDLYAGTPTTDRNLYVNAIQYDGATTTENAGIFWDYTATYTIAGSAPVPVTYGSGGDTLVLTMSEDYYQGDAQFTVSIDGAQVGGTFTTTARNSLGQTQSFTLQGNWGSGPHVIGVTFTNDLYAGTPSTDRNLYVNAIQYDGTSITENAGILWDYTASYALPATPPAPVSSGSGPDTLVLHVSEDFYQGNAQFTVSVDSTQVGGTFTTTAQNSLGQTQSFTLQGNWGSGAHVIGITFLNDLYAGTPSTDRNLTVDTIQYDGTSITENAAIDWNYTANYAIGTGPIPQGSVTFTDSAGHKLSQSLITTGTLNTYSGNGSGLIANVYQWMENATTVGISPSAYGVITTAAITDTGGASFHLMNFIESDATLSGATTAAANLVIDSARLGTIVLGAGSYNTTINAAYAGGSAAANTFTVTMGSGTDSLTLNGSYGITQAAVHAGTGTDTMRFANTGAVTVTAGTGADSITAGSGAETFIWHGGNGLMTIANFLPAQGDTIHLDKSMQSSLHETTSSAGTLISFGTDTSHGVMLQGVSSVSNSSLVWS